MARQRKKRRIPLGVMISGIVGASIATMIAISPQWKIRFDRRDLAVGMQQQFRSLGLPYAVATAGPSDTILRIEAPSMTKPFAQYLIRDPAKGQQLGERGFASVVFANGRGGRWTYDIARGSFE